MKSVLVVPDEDLDVIAVLNHDGVISMRIDNLIVDPKMRFVFMASSKIFNGENPKE